jgi:aromatic-L-amino-acid decarboxylase
MVLSYFGHDALAATIRRHIQLAAQFAQWVDEAADFERMAPTPLSTVCFRAHPAGMEAGSDLDRWNEHLLERVNATGTAFLSHTRLRGNYVLRLAIGNLRTEEHHVRQAWELLQALNRDRTRDKA